MASSSTRGHFASIAIPRDTGIYTTTYILYSRCRLIIDTLSKLTQVVDNLVQHTTKYNSLVSIDDSHRTSRSDISPHNCNIHRFLSLAVDKLLVVARLSIYGEKRTYLSNQ